MKMKRKYLNKYKEKTLASRNLCVFNYSKLLALGGGTSESSKAEMFAWKRMFINISAWRPI